MKCPQILRKQFDLASKLVPTQLKFVVASRERESRKSMMMMSNVCRKSWLHTTPMWPVLVLPSVNATSIVRRNTMRTDDISIV